MSMKIQIHNLRLGFATNSSSSHSILLLPSREMAREISPSPNYDGYGWEDFTLTDPLDKRHYLATQVGAALGFQSWANTTEERNHNMDVVKQIGYLIGDRFEEPTYVDHQSTWAFPGSWKDPGKPDPEFMRELSQFLESDRVVVLGGNDNSDGHPLVERPDYLDEARGRGGGPMREYVWRYPFTEWGSQHQIVARNDKTHWVLFDRASGTKARLSFSDLAAPDKALTPELVDVKITDYCPFGCSFCYQDSTPRGKHASPKQIDEVVRILAKAKVFEVAIGGGEPTLHPHFISILEKFREVGIVPNFTTRNLGWLSKKRSANRIMKLAGAFAYSAHTPDDVDKLAAAVKGVNLKGVNEWHRTPAVIHIVMGTVGRRELGTMLRRARKHRFGVTLLGWKTTGRADAKPDKPYLDWWLETVKKHGGYQVGIDTALAAEAEAAGQMEEFPRWMYHTTDGNFSCYVDAVAETTAPSSWQPERGSWPLAQMTKAFQREWA